MNIEQRLTTALRHVDDVQPSDDLWERVLHSIDEERQHRRRVVHTVAVTLTTLVGVVAVGVAASQRSGHGRFVHRPTLEMLEIAVLIVLVVVLGPAIRRFGRGFARDLWPAGCETPRALLRLLDVAYFLVFSGYILLSTEFEFGEQWRAVTLGEQLGDAAQRFGGLLLLVGVLHALTIAALPIVALVDNSTRAGKPLPRWMIVVAVIIAIQTLPGLLLLVIGAMGG